MAFPVNEAELRKRLTPEQYHVTREKGTERAFSGKFYKSKETGVYHCVVCDLALFSSDAKFDSGTGTAPHTHTHKYTVTQTYTMAVAAAAVTCADISARTGWPSFWQALPGAVAEEVDISYGMRRVESVCARCKSHLGHVFDDGPRDKTGLRYCMNSASLDFKGGK
jgi:peptide-methionine (R)-S-oxide reductase